MEKPIWVYDLVNDETGLPDVLLSDHEYPAPPEGHTIVGLKYRTVVSVESPENQMRKAHDRFWCAVLDLFPKIYGK